MTVREVDTELATMDPIILRELLAFNVTKQRIVDLCNKEFAEQLTENHPRDYSSWNRALNGKETWIGLTDKLEGLHWLQSARPSEFLPDVKPHDCDDLSTWMKQIGGAPWWLETLKLDIPKPSFLSWYSGRSMHADKIDDVRVAVCA